MKNIIKIITIFIISASINIRSVSAKDIKPNTMINFPDKNFENIVRKKINKSKGDIIYSDVSSITYFNNYPLSLKHTIKSIEGIQYFKSLEVLKISNSDLSNLKPLSKLKNLVNIKLNNNKITNIQALKSLTNLKYLSLNNNFN